MFGTSPKYPCVFNVGETFHGDKVWCALLGKGSIKAQLVHEEICKNCDVRLGKAKEPELRAKRMFEQVHGQYNATECIYSNPVKDGCCSQSHSTIYCAKFAEKRPISWCRGCEARTVGGAAKSSTSLVIPVFNLASNRLSALTRVVTSLSSYADDIHIVAAYRASEKDSLLRTIEALNAKVYPLLRTEGQEYFLKEELLNWALRNLDLRAHVAFLDADSQLQSRTWISQGLHYLRHGYQFVQLYDTCLYLDNKGAIELSTQSSVKQLIESGGKKYGCPGLGWMAELSTWKQVGGFPSIIATGNGDTVFYYAVRGLAQQLSVPQPLLSSLEVYKGRPLAYLKGVMATHWFDGVSHKAKRYEEKIAAVPYLDNALFTMASNGLPEFCVNKDHEVRKLIEDVNRT